jgi:ribosomal protein S18 acetylase RimI-like enzyme
MAQQRLSDLSWRREVSNKDFLISTQPSLLDLNFINTAFASPDMDWAKPVPEDHLALMLSQSISPGLYEVLPPAPPPATVDEPSTPRTPSPTTEGPPEESLKQIGFARLITDHVTTAYLTDVYVLPEYRGLGLGKWLTSCCNEAIELHPYLRRALLFASAGVGEKFYSAFGFWSIEREKETKVIMTRKAFKKIDEGRKETAVNGELGS